MKKPIPPCGGCDFRTDCGECHKTCKAYQQYKADMEVYNTMVLERKKADKDGWVIHTHNDYRNIRKERELKKGRHR